MKVYIFILLFLFSCKEPNVFIQEDYVISEVHYETIDKCRGIDVSGDVLVAAATHNGYMRYNIINDNNGNTSLELAVHVSDLVGEEEGDAAFDVAISNNMHDMAFIVDDVDPIQREDFDNPGTLYELDPCGNSSIYRDLALNDDIPDTTILFTLQKHGDAAPIDGFLYSTSVGIREYFYSDGLWEAEDEPPCETVAYFDINTMEISYSNNILAVAQGGLGVQIHKYNRYIAEPFTDALNGEYDEGEEFVDSSGNGEYDEGEEFTDALNGVYDPSICDGLPPGLEWLYSDEQSCEEGGFTWIEGEEFQDTLVEDGIYTVFKDSLAFKDNFYIQGGEAESLFSINNFVIGGFDNDRGCYMALLDSDGSIMSNLTFAEGYSINAIDYDNGFLALAAGNDGILIYQWDGSLDVDFLTNIDSGDDNYVYDIKVDGNNVYTASENGISIYKIEGN